MERYSIQVYYYKHSRLDTRKTFRLFYFVFRAPQDTSGSEIELRLVGGRTSDEGRVEAKTSDGKSSYIKIINYMIRQNLEVFFF